MTCAEPSGTLSSWPRTPDAAPFRWWRACATTMNYRRPATEARSSGSNSRNVGHGYKIPTALWSLTALVLLGFTPETPSREWRRYRRRLSGKATIIGRVASMSLCAITPTPVCTLPTRGREAVPSSASSTSQSSRTSGTARPSPTNPRYGKRLRPTGRLKSNPHQSRSVLPPEQPRAPSSPLKSARNGSGRPAPPYASDARTSGSAGIARISRSLGKLSALTAPRSTASDNAERHRSLAQRGHGGRCRANHR